MLLTKTKTGEFLTRTGIRRPETEIGLGARVRYHHLACEVRKAFRKEDALLWSGEPQPTHWVECGVGRHAVRWNPFTDGLFTQLSNGVNGKTINKSIATWPEEGSGCAIGLIRRGIGHSYKGYMDSFNQEWEAGGFDCSEWIWLFMIKTDFGGLQGIVLAPMDAVEAIDD